jgi:hypothetical protein
MVGWAPQRFKSFAPQPTTSLAAMMSPMQIPICVRAFSDHLVGKLVPEDHVFRERLGMSIAHVLVRAAAVNL